MLLSNTLSCYSTQHFLLVISLAKGQNSSSQEPSLPIESNETPTSNYLGNNPRLHPGDLPNIETCCKFLGSEPSLFVVTVQRRMKHLHCHHRDVGFFVQTLFLL